MLVSPARRSVWSFETRWTGAASVRKDWMRVSEAMLAHEMSRHKESPAPRNEGLCRASCRTSLDSLVEQVPDSQDVDSGAELEEESV